MLVFPQLSSGAISQFPLQRRAGFRTLVNQSPDGHEIRAADANLMERSWELAVQSLTDAEWKAIQDLFTAAEGRLQTFLFLEPGENLLAWSETFTAPAWTSNGLRVAEGIADPLGGTLASELSGTGTLTQSLRIPASFQYAAAIWARASQPGASLELSDGAGQQAAALFLGDGQWRRYTLSIAWSSASPALAFIVNAPGGSPVDIYGAQLEAQPLPSAYKQTLVQSGVHPAARFAADALSDRLTAPGQHSGTIQITWTPSPT